MITIIRSTIFRCHDRPAYSNINDHCVFCSYNPQYVYARCSWCRILFLHVFVSVCVTLASKAVKSRIEQNRYSWRWYTSYGAADKIIRRRTAYEVYGGLRWLTAEARGSKCSACFSGTGVPNRRRRYCWVGWQYVPIGFNTNHCCILHSLAIICDATFNY